MKRLISFLILLISFTTYSQEICDNGLDDDFDGLIDLQDTTDCICKVATPDTTSLLANPSFESRTCCPSTLSQMTCVNNWLQASIPTPDYFNTCGTTGIWGAQLPLFPIPGAGAGYVGFYSATNWEENIGTCLTSPMVAGKSYTLSVHLAWGRFDSLFNFRLYGTPNCTDLPWATDTCPVGSGSWVQLAGQAVQLSTTGAWTNISVTFTPTVNINAISIGGPCGGQPTDYSYYYADELKLNESSKLFSPFAKITNSGHYCRGNLVLKSNYDSLPNFFQWYKDSIAIIGATDSTYSVPNGGLGNYQIRLEYDSGCVITEVYLVDTTNITFDIDSSGSCPIGLATGEILVSNTQNGTKPYEYKINSAPFVTDTFFNNLSPGNYTITVRDSNLCESAKSITVEAFPMPTASFIADTVCLGEPTTFTDKSTIAKGLIIQWGWNTSGSPTTQSTSYTYETDGVYSVTHVVVSDSGCIDDTTIDVLVNPLPTVDFIYNPIEIYTFNPDVCFSNLSSGAIAYVWDFNFSGPTSTLTSPCTVKFPADQERTYRVKLVAISDKGCKDSSYLDVTILDEFILYMPNSFTPNGDNINDELRVVTAGINKYEILIFNNWGEVIFSSNDPSLSWDGKHNGVAVPIGSYVYKIYLKAENRQVKEIIGHVNVLR